MVDVPVYQFDSDKVSKSEVDETVFGERILWKLLHQAIVMYQANRRVGTHSTKTRAEVKGAMQKPWRQKGTGRARAGSRKSPIWRGGGVVFGPKPRDYSYAMPRKSLRAALRSALLGKLRDGEVIFLEGAQMDAPKTKVMCEVLGRIEGSGTTLFVLPENDANLFKSTRNIARTEVRIAAELNAYDVVRHDRLVITRDGFDRLVERVGHGGN
jgi:large subunit ribosomal protein L4